MEMICQKIRTRCERESEECIIIFQILFREERCTTGIKKYPVLEVNEQRCKNHINLDANDIRQFICESNFKRGP
jgi:hypothetical protein